MICVRYSLRVVLLGAVALTLPALAQQSRQVVSGTQHIAAKPIAPTGDISRRLTEMEKALTKQSSEAHVAGFSIVVVKDGKPIYIKGVGMKDLDHKKPVTPDTLFAIGSSSKAFTAMTMMMSADEGKLSLSDPPRKYLPYFKLQDPDADAKMTLSDLMCHRCGLARTDFGWATGRLTSEEIIRVAGEAKPTAKFGEKFQYQNVMFLTAGQIVGTVENKPWSAVVADRIFKPLGMSRTETSISTMQHDADYSLGYSWDDENKKFTQLPMRDLIGIAPAGAINSSARDMSRWVEFMLNSGVWNGKRLVSEKSFAELYKTHMSAGGAVGYGYGWFLRDWHGHAVMEHGGNIDGFSAQVALMPDQHLGFALLTNANATAFAPGSIETVFNSLLGSPKKPESTAKAGPATNPAAEIGVYRLDAANLDVTIGYKDRTLTLTVPGQPTYKLESDGGRKYNLAGLTGFSATFRPSKSDPTLTELSMVQPQGNFVAVRGGKPKAKLAEPNAAPMITSDELMAKVIEAAGGEVNLRKHRSCKLVTSSNLENQGVQTETVEYSNADGAECKTSTFYALGKKIAIIHEYFNGVRGGTESTLSPDKPYGPKEIAAARIDAGIYGLSNWKRLFSSIVVKRKAKIGDEDVYVIEKTPRAPGLQPVTDYISTKTFQVLKRESAVISKIGPLPVVETFEDYRDVDGIKMAFKHTAEVMGATTVESTTSVEFDMPALSEQLSHSLKPLSLGL